jgi:signal transduction histidine kinase
MIEKRGKNMSSNMISLDEFVSSVKELFQSKPEQAAELAEARLRKDTKHATPQHLIELYNTLCQHYQNIGNYDLAIKKMASAHKLIKKVEPDIQIKLEQAYADVLIRVNNFEEAIKHLTNALKIATKYNKVTDIVNTNILLGRCYCESFDYESALNSMQSALTLAKDIPNKITLYRIYIGLGNISCATVNLTKAEEYYKQSVAITKKYGNLQQHSEALSALSKTYTLKKKYDLALKYAYQALDILKQANQPDIVARMMLNIGIILNNIDKLKESLEYLQQASELTDKNANPMQYIRILLTMANSYNKIGEYKLAWAYQKEIVDICTKFNAKDILMVTYELGYQIARNQGKWKQALDYLELHLNELNSIWNQEKEIEYKNLENHYEVIKKQHEAEIYRLKNVDLKKRNKVIVTQKKQLEIALQNLKQANDTKNKLFSIIAHDLRGPLGSLYQGLELAVEDDFSIDESKAFLSNMQTMAFQVYNLTDNLLRWALQQMDMIVNKSDKVELAPLIYKVITQHQMLINAKQINVVREIDTPYPAWVDSGLFEVVFRNLLANAIKFSNVKGSIVIKVKPKGKFYEISVKDSGNGISQDVMDIVFSDAHSKITDGTAKEKGFGLGLRVCKEFVSKMDGMITVKSTIGKGSTFTFTVPLSK